MTVNSIGKYNTSFGLAFVVKCSETIKVGQNVVIDGIAYSVKKILMSTNPSDEDIVTLLV
jgi:hypothetical protein